MVCHAFCSDLSDPIQLPGQFLISRVVCRHIAVDKPEFSKVRKLFPCLKQFEPEFIAPRIGVVCSKFTDLIKTREDIIQRFLKEVKIKSSFLYAGKWKIYIKVAFRIY